MIKQNIEELENHISIILKEKISIFPQYTRKRKIITSLYGYNNSKTTDVYISNREKMNIIYKNENNWLHSYLFDDSDDIRICINNLLNKIYIDSMDEIKEDVIKVVAAICDTVIEVVVDVAKAIVPKIEQAIEQDIITTNNFMINTIKESI